MNKKSLILLVLPAFLLSGCNKEISPADAKAKAKEIEQHEVKAEDYKALSLTAKTHYEASGKSGGKTGSMSEDEEYVIEFSVDDSYFHTKTYGKSVVDEKTEVEELEIWAYIDGGTFITATRTVEEEKESKIYVEIPDVGGSAQTAFKTALDKTVKSALDAASNKSYLQQVENYADNKTAEGETAEVKYYTAGDGNLTVEGKSTYAGYTYRAVKADGSGTAKIVWDKYLLSEIASSMELHAVDAESDTDATMKISENASLKFEAKVARPNLSEFQKGLL